MELQTVLETEEQMKELVNDLLEELNNIEDNNKIENILAKKLIDHGVTENIDAAEAVLAEIESALQTVDQNFNDLVLAKSLGKSRSEWFQDRLEEIIESNKSIVENDLIKGISDALQDSNNSLLHNLFDNQMGLSKNLTSINFEDINKKAIVQNFLTNVQQNTFLTGLLFDALEMQDYSQESEKTDNNLLRSYFNAELGDSKDKMVKKALTVSLLISTKKGWAPLLNNKSAEYISYIVDRGLTTSKVAFKLAKGDIGPLDAVDYLIDRGAAKVVTIVKKACIKGGGAIGSKIGAAIGATFGPIGVSVGAKIGRVAGELAGGVVGDFITKGIDKLAAKGKEVIGNTISGFKSLGNSISSGLKSIFS